MPSYQAPADDYRFILNDFLKVQDRHDLQGYQDLTPELCTQLLESAARFHEEVLFPIGAQGDAEGAKLEDGRVRTPSVYKEAWKAYRESGWLAISLPEAIGGAGLPAMLSSAIGEMRLATAQSLHMYVGFCISVARMLHVTGDAWMREQVVPRLAAGEWTATMCMTESHCGTDLRQIRTRATPLSDGTWSIDGTKIFISGGDHDLADNIMHIVLAKVPDEKGGISPGLSSVNVFLVPKLQIDPLTGATGQANGVYVDSIEHKMGIEGNATCVIRFAGARGWRVAATPESSGGGASNMAPMFMLMNYARVGTALSGVAYAELAAQNATSYARERLAGRAPGGARFPHLPGDPLIVQPDVRRLLLGARSFAEGGRATAMRALLWQQEAESTTTGDRRQVARDLMELMTPVMKAYFTDQAFTRVNDCLQVLGGHGYTRDYGLEQMVRNVRVGQIYEGANGIQAIDLVQRKLPAAGWRSGRSLVAELRRFAQAPAASAGQQAFVDAVGDAADHLEATFATLSGRADAADPATNLAVAYDVLEMCGIALLGWTWAEMALILNSARSLSDAARRRKLACARFWMDREMPRLAFLRGRIASGFNVVSELDDQDL